MTLKRFLPHLLWLGTFAVQVICICTFRYNKSMMYVNPTVLWLSYLVQAVLAIKLIQPKVEEDIVVPTWTKWLPLLATALGLLPLGFVMAKFPGGQGSDVLPTIEILCDRLLHGEQPYQSVKFDTYTIFPPYLTLQWAVFAPFRALGIDLRWIAWGIVPLVWLWILQRMQGNGLFVRLMQLLPAFVWGVVVALQGRFIGQTIEGLLVVYYLILAFGLARKSFGMIATGLVLCLLSRYALLFWIPFLLLMVAMYEDRKKAIQWTLIMAGALLLFYVLPFILQDPSIFAKSWENYSSGTLAGWKQWGDWQKPGEPPYTLTQGVGMAVYFWRMMPDNPAQAIQLLQLTQIGLSIAVCLILWLYYHKNREKLALYPFLLIMFSAYLGTFYAFHTYPFSYYQMVPLSVSILLGNMWGEKSES